MWEKVSLKILNFDNVTGENYPNWPPIPYYLDRILINGDSGWGKTNTLLNLISHQPNINKIYLFAEDPYEGKYQLLINKHESGGSKHCKDPKVFIEYSNDTDDIFENINEYNRNKKFKVLIVFDQMQTFINYNFLCTRFCACKTVLGARPCTLEIVDVKEQTCTLLIITLYGSKNCTKLVLKPLAAKNGFSISLLCIAPFL